MTLLILCLFLISHSTFKPSYTTYDGFYYDHIYKNNLNFFRERFVQSTFLHFETHVTLSFTYIIFSLQHRTFLRSNSKVNKSKKLYIDTYVYETDT